MLKMAKKTQKIPIFGPKDSIFDPNKLKIRLKILAKISFFVPKNFKNTHFYPKLRFLSEKRSKFADRSPTTMHFFYFITHPYWRSSQFLHVIPRLWSGFFFNRLESNHIRFIPFS